MRLAAWIWLVIPAVPTAAHADVASALAHEKLAGTVLVHGDTVLEPTADTARKHAGTTYRGKPLALRVIADRGDVVEVSTGSVDDCVASFERAYEVHAFVPRSALVPRAAEAVTKQYADGTGVAIAPGAPVDITASGAAWIEPMLVLTGVTPTNIKYSLAKPVAASLPPAGGEQLICDPSPQTQDEWKKSLAERERVEAERKKAECEARRAATPPPKRSRPSTKRSKADELADEASALAEQLESVRCDADLGSIRRPLADDRFAPWCGVSEHTDPLATDSLPEPKLGGKAIGWQLWNVEQDRVARASGRYLADLTVACGLVRVEVTAPSVQRVGRGAVGLGGGHHLRWWIDAGRVTWPDGKPAGKLLYQKVVDEREATEQGGRLCVKIDGFGEALCSSKGAFSRGP